MTVFKYNQRRSHHDNRGRGFSSVAQGLTIQVEGQAFDYQYQIIITLITRIEKQAQQCYLMIHQNPDPVK